MLDLTKIIEAQVLVKHLDKDKMYIVGVSGGVDSVTLLFCLRKAGFKKLLVAHFDHGIRDDSSADRILTSDICKRYGYPFVYQQAHLPSGASEELARNMRWCFLRAVAKQANAVSIITAHHFDDELETALMFIIRGTGRKGFSSLRTVPDVVRPFLQVTKQDILKYANNHHLVWREDSTNEDTEITRNYIRLQIVPALKNHPEIFNRLLFLLKRQHKLNEAIDCGLNAFLHEQPEKDQLNRYFVTLLPHIVAVEFVAQWLRLRGIRSRSKKFLDSVVVFIKSSKQGAKMSLTGSIYLSTSKSVVEMKYNHTQ